MKPTLRHNDRILVRRFNGTNEFFEFLNFDYSNLRQGDIVVYKHPSNPGRWELKRIIGLEGDVVTSLKNPLKANSEPIKTKIKPGHCFLEGDGNRDYNLSREEDSNRFGQVPVSLIIGKVLVQYSWWSLIDHHKWEWNEVERSVPLSRIEFSKFTGKKFVSSLVDSEVRKQEMMKLIDENSGRKGPTDYMAEHLNQAREAAKARAKEEKKSTAA